MPDPTFITCRKCRRSVPYDETIFVSANWSDTRASRGGGTLIVCRPCSVRVLDQLRALLEPREPRR